MRITLARKENEFRLRPSTEERRLLIRVLAGIAENYRLLPEDLDQKTRGVWYATGGCASAGLSPEDTQEWVKNLQAFKGEHLRLVQGWLEDLKSAAPGAGGVRVRQENVPVLLTVLNDHRLMAAAQNDIGETEMSIRTTEALARLTPGRLRALIEIQFLAQLIESLLDHLPGQPGRWNVA